jgi:P27 family predicted phage terminase small subunit
MLIYYEDSAMPAGRPPKPTTLKVLHGTDRPDRVNANEPKPSADGVKAPSWVKGKARTQWKKIAPMLQDMGVLTVADETALGLLCDALAEYIEAQEMLRKLGRSYAVITEAGSEMWRPRPEVSMAQDAWRRVNNMLGQFGMTPSSRAKLSAITSDEDGDSILDQLWSKSG